MAVSKRDGSNCELHPGNVKIKEEKKVNLPVLYDNKRPKIQHRRQIGMEEDVFL